jgi:hypothetical protein
MKTLTLPRAITYKGIAITEVQRRNVNISDNLQKVLVQVESTVNNKINRVITLWEGVKKDDAPTPDPLAGTYFIDRATTEDGIDAKIIDKVLELDGK